MAITEVSAGGIVYYRDADVLYILMVADGHNRWSFPKGLVQRGESPEAAALREIAEETGIQGTIITHLGDSHYVYRRNRLLINKTVHFFLVQASTTTVQPQLEEVSDARWLTAADALAASAFPANTTLLHQALALLEHPSANTT
jgi:8-oxo-dGTP diphosphatase